MANILIVDDSKTARLMLKHWVKTINGDLAVLEAANAEEALDLMPRLSPSDMALIDYNMPGMTGVELAEQLMARVPIGRMTLATANIQDAVRQRAEELGMRYMAKPMTPVKLNQAIQQMECG